MQTSKTKNGGPWRPHVPIDPMATKIAIEIWEAPEWQWAMSLSLSLGMKSALTVNTRGRTMV